MPRPLALALLAALSLVATGCPDDEDEVSCPAGQTACGGVCFDLQADPLSCGACLRVCAEGAACEAGECRCPAGQSICGGACVDLQANASHCGECGQACGLGTCTSGACACQAGATDECGGNPACVDFLTDPSNCGGCGVGCLARGFCDAGSCACSASFPEPCETYCADFTSTSDCGACGNACAAGGLCDTTQLPTDCRCPGTEIVCGDTGGSPGTCVDATSDEANCGLCGRRCPTLATCTGSTCGCPGTAPDVCGATSTSPGACVSRQTDEANCGTCGRVCPTSATCQAGSCTCPAAQPQTCGSGCCAGDQCCGTGGSACQPAHANGLGQVYFLGCELFGPSETTREAALRAADAWAPGLTYDGTTACGVECVGRQTGNQCAVWCFGSSGWAGHVGLNTINNACTCPSPTSPAWN